MLINEVEVNVSCYLPEDIILGDALIEIKFCVKQFLLNLWLVAHHKLSFS